MKVPESPRLLVIDDDPEWCSLLEAVAASIGYQLDTALSLELAKVELATAAEKQIVYAAAIIDMNFELASTGIDYPRGKEVMQFIKTNYPKVACIVVSGVPMSPGEVLDLRDKYDLDYFVEKDRCDLDVFNTALQKALRRVEVRYNPQTLESDLRATLAAWERTQLAMSQSLALLQEREAKMGLTADIKTLNELSHYRTNLQEAEKQIAELKARLAAIQ
jgi:CheY-like chemotaxis protein